MGLGSYFKAKPKREPSSAPEPERLEQPTPQYADNMEMPPSPQFGSSKNSISGHSYLSGTSHIEDIKHEVMISFLYQQQCSNMWVNDQSGHVEGVVLRKLRGNYLACPPALAQSDFQRACSSLNVQVSTMCIYRSRSRYS